MKGVEVVLYDSCFSFRISRFFFPIHNSLNSKGEMIGNLLPCSLKSGDPCITGGFPFFLSSLQDFAFLFLFIFLFLIQKSQNSRHKLHDRKYTVSSFPKKLVNGKIHDLGVVLYDSCLTFQFSSFFPVHKSAENNTRSSSCDCSPQVLV